MTDPAPRDRAEIEADQRLYWDALTDDDVADAAMERLADDVRPLLDRLDATESVTDRMTEWARGDEPPSLTLLAKWVHDLRAAVAGAPLLGKHGPSPDPLLPVAENSEQGQGER